jgi:hypothetical protein
MHDLLQTLTEILIPVLASVITALSAIAIKKLQKKFDIELSANENEMIKTLIRDGIASAEEWAARKAKLSPEDVVSGRIKAERVTSMVKAVYPQLTDNEIAFLIDAEIARANRLGSTGDKVEI